MSRVLRYLWAGPTTLLGLVLAFALLRRGQAALIDGVIEAHSPLLGRALTQLTPLAGGAEAVTLGHVVIGRNAVALEATRTHERVHVRQYELWGPLFVPAYLIAGLCALASGGHPYFDNRFERQARLRHKPTFITLIALALVVWWLAPNAAAQSEQVPTILISRQLATAEGLRVGDALALASKPDGASARRFRVAGIYEPVADPMRLAAKRLEARLHLPDLLSLTADSSDPLSTESVTAINVALRDRADADAFARDVSAAIPIPQLTARAAQGGEGTATIFVVLDRFHFAIALVTVIASTLFLLALMVMLVEERRETVGILRLIGLRKGRILLQVFAEGLLIAAAGAVFGIVFAAALQGTVNTFFQWRYDTSLIFVRITPQIAFRCVLLAVPLGVLASLISSWTLLRSNVLDLARR